MVAEIIAQAAGIVKVATNMVGSGTDILLAEMNNRVMLPHICSIFLVTIDNLNESISYLK